MEFTLARPAKLMVLACVNAAKANSAESIKYLTKFKKSFTNKYPNKQLY